MNERKPIFSVLRDQFEVDFMRGSGNGGQNRNKRATACRIKHRASGAVATAQEHRTQLQNKKAAFRRLCETPKFRAWLKMQTGRAVATEDEIQRRVEEWMSPTNLRVEVGDGKHWKLEMGEKES